MRTLAIGDIHGCIKSLKTLVDFVKFSPDDTIVTLGDYIDRGPDSKGVIDYLLELRETHNLITLKGNHEAMILDSRNYPENVMHWLINGGIATLDSFEAIEVEDIQDRYWDFFKSCKLFHETDRHIFVHAGLAPNLNMDEQIEYDVLWLRFKKTKQHQSGKKIICGHTPQRPPVPTVKKHAICIDTGVYNRGGWLTCFEPDSGEYWQANEQGETRSGRVKIL